MRVSWTDRLIVFMVAVLGILGLWVILFNHEVHAQNNANIIGSIAGTTLANCGTPATPTICIVATGVYVWQNSTDGWILVGAATPPPPVGVTSITINGTTKTGAASFALTAGPSTISAQ